MASLPYAGGCAGPGAVSCCGYFCFLLVVLLVASNLPELPSGNQSATMNSLLGMDLPNATSHSLLQALSILAGLRRMFAAFCVLAHQHHRLRCLSQLELWQSSMQTEAAIACEVDHLVSCTMVKIANCHQVHMQELDLFCEGTIAECFRAQMKIQQN